MKRILLLEDDIILRSGIILALSREDYEFSECGTVQSAKELLKQTDFDLLLLDINLPDGSGVELCQTIRKTNKIPIILLTAMDLELDIVAGLESGADDYITKPFSLMVLRARVNALLRRLEDSNEHNYKKNPFLFNFNNMEFFKNNNTIILSKTEQKLLRLLVTNQNNTLARNMLLERIWADGCEFVDENALSVTIKRLRDKLEDIPANPKYIKTVYGIGYKWVC